ncbi:MAG: energy-coupling factor ABC transporter ATP-binding protein [Planctomycetaceae bacterium]|nr:energy-coupling factor ABC transporter ATP-binding protein [Planctomycetaceae bacterium]
MSDVAIQIEDLGYTFAGRNAPTLSDVSCRLPPGSWTVLAGRTGSGKSTLLRALAGLIPHHAAGEMTGRVLLCGHDTRGASTAALARTVGLVLQAPRDQICTTRVESEVAFGLENLATPLEEFEPRIAESLEAVGLNEYRHCAIEELSGGQQQRVILASILALRPQVLLLDEPLSQLDRDSARELLDELQRLRAQGVTIVMAEHRLAGVLPSADRVLALQQGGLRDLGHPSSATAMQGLAEMGYDFAPEQFDWRLPSRVEPLPPQAAEPARVALSVRDLSFRYPSWNATHWTLRNVSFDVRPGERLAVVGANGSGKSTLFGLLAGLLRPTAGTIRRPQESADRYPLGMVLQQADLMLFCRTVREELAFGPRRLRLDRSVVEQRVRMVARQLDLESFLDEPPQALSQGERLRVALGATLALDPQVLVLDEPTTGLDAEQLERLVAAIGAREGGAHEHRTVIFSTHDLRTVARCADRVIVLDRGELVVAGPVDQVVRPQ